MSRDEKITNIAKRLREAAARLGGKPAVYQPVRRGKDGKVIYDSWSFKQLEDESDSYASGLVSLGVGRGVRALLMVRPGFDFIALSFALFKAGAQPVLIDPGMGKANLLDCVARAEPEAMIAIPRAHLARLVYPKYFRSVKHLVTVGRKWFWRGVGLDDIRVNLDRPFAMADVSADEPAAILFTTGSTGPPKGVVYEHGMFDAQVKLIRDYYGITEDDVDLPAFPLFALFSVAMGMSVVIPDMDPTRPAGVDPAKIVEAIRDKGVTFTFGSPAIWKKVSEYCYGEGIKLPTLKKVLMAGAPVPEIIHRRLMGGVLPSDGETRTPFGATESLPVCDITGRELIDETVGKTKQGAGVCVGRPLPGINVEIICISDDAIPNWSESLLLPQGEIGEIVVSGPVVTKKYYNAPEQTGMAKIIDPETGVVRHRMGDVGYLDEKGRVWFLGRKSHRVITPSETMFTIACEAIFNRHPDVARSALVGAGEAPDQRPVIIIEIDKGRKGIDKAALRRELLMFAEASPLTDSIRDVLFHPEFPTDVRHNAKIFREKLKVWAEKELGA